MITSFRFQKRTGEEVVSRIEPVEPPYEADVAARLDVMMPPGVPPIGLFRTFVRNLPMATAMGGWGAYELSKRLSLTIRDREIVIDRTCARCRCEYEWGVHIAFFAERAAFTREQITSITHGRATDSCWVEERDRVLFEATDALHDGAHIDDTLWQRLNVHLSDQQALDLCMLAGWYHAISYAANSARVDLEPGGPRFADF